MNAQVVDNYAMNLAHTKYVVVVVSHRDIFTLHVFHLNTGQMIISNVNYVAHLTGKNTASIVEENLMAPY